MRLIATCLTVLLMSAASTVATAGPPLHAPGQASTSTTKTDADDLDEPLDISAGTLSLKGSDVKVVVETYEPIDPDALYDNNLILAQFKTGSNTARTIYFLVGGPKLTAQVCTLYLDGSKASDHCSKLQPSKPDSSSVAVRIPRNKIKPGMTTYKWRLTSFPYSAGCQSTTTCTDHAPDGDGWFTWKSA